MPPHSARHLKARVDAYFEESGRSRKGDWRLHIKSIGMIALFFVPWALFSFGSIGGGMWFWIAEIAMGFGLAGIGLNVMHDANHGSYSQSKKVNSVVGRVLDLVGGSAPLWRIQHNVLHHSFTNISGLDEDIDTPGILRFTPDRPSQEDPQAAIHLCLVLLLHHDVVLDDRERLDCALSLQKQRPH